MHTLLRTTLTALILSVSTMTGATEARQILVGVNGLVCAFCAHGIQRALQKENATAQVDVDLEAGRVTIELKPDGDISDDRLRQLLTDAGYTVTHIDRGSTDAAHD
ncbi:MAG: heavy-metal-associated domain-containing protein [Xanthomonadales bacterium]|jgi:mercuric ion binding protein|nr:heavy-metal-associated domain-containing protein [Xanthomonadales bacterium]